MTKEIAKWNVVILTPGFASDETEDNCIPPLQAFVKGLHQQGLFQVKVISLVYPKVNTPFWWHDIRIYPCYQTGLLGKLSSWSMAYKYLRSFHDSQAIDVLHSFWASDVSLLGGLFSRGRKLAHITTLMGQDSRRYNRYLPLLKFGPSSYVALSQRQARDWAELTSQPVESIIPWGTLTDDFQDVEKGLKAIDVIGIGSLTANKNYDDFLHVVDLLRRDNPHLRALIVGDGPMMTSLQRSIDKRDLKHHVTLAGAKSRKETLHLLAQSKILLHPSFYESFGYVFSEARHLGVAIVSRGVGQAPVQSTAHWCVGENIRQLYNGCLHFLKQEPEIEPHQLPMIDTIWAYQTMYENKILKKT